MRNCALRLLARREHSRGELMQKLLQRGYDSKSIQETLDDLSEQDLQSDERFTEMYVHHRIQSGFGPRRIIYELQERRIASDLISRYVPNDFDYWKEKLENLFQKKSFDKNNPAKLMRFFFSRGFDADLIRKTLKP